MHGAACCHGHRLDTRRTMFQLSFFDLKISSTALVTSCDGREELAGRSEEGGDLAATPDPHPGRALELGQVDIARHPTPTEVFGCGYTGEVSSALAAAVCVFSTRVRTYSPIL